MCFLSGMGELPRCQGSSGHSGLCVMGWTCPVSSQTAVLPGLSLWAPVMSLRVLPRQCTVTHAVSIGCLSVKPKRNLKLAESKTATSLRLTWICHFKRILKVLLCYTETGLCNFAVFLPAYFCLKAADITFTFILVHEYSC